MYKPDFDTIEGRRTFVQRALFTAQKARSNAIERNGDDPESLAILADLFPHLFGGPINLVEMTARILEIDHYDDSAIMNLLIIGEKESLFSALYGLQAGEDWPNWKTFMKTKTLTIH